ncbi:protein kinase domain-containing protein [Streptomyces sp. cmx-18-6]|uniref:protein kinase domain-containing protein n=1 Tax=Streptomyces sp. cmx-18-6 TaxID=2790930 RepID=UPI0039807568
MGDVFSQGEILAGGRYRIDGLLGSGGMAQVYRAHDLSLARAVAIKTMLPGFTHDASHPERFRREAQAMAALRHPHVVTVHDTGEEPRADGPPVPYFVMELVPGPSLADRIRADGLPVSAAVRITDQILSALAASHAQGLVHRDIKPANILLAGDGIAKVADFGIARAAAGAGRALTDTRMTIGTPQYMSPEQVHASAHLDGRSDLYAVGVLLFEMMTGRTPFNGPDAFAIAYRHLHEPPPTLASFGISAHPRLEPVLARALAKLPEQRYPDAESMRIALRMAVAPSPPPRRMPMPPPTPVPTLSPGLFTPDPAHVRPQWRTHITQGVRLTVSAILMWGAMVFVGMAQEGGYTIPLTSGETWAFHSFATAAVMAAAPAWSRRSRQQSALWKTTSWLLMTCYLFMWLAGAAIIHEAGSM